MHRTGYGLILLTALIAACNNNNPVLDAYPFPDGQVFFTHPPLDLAGALSFIPMGAPNVQPKDHGGFPLRFAYRFPAATPVLAVRGGVIFEVRHGFREVPPIPDAPEALWGRQYEDWAFRLQVGRNVIANYAHVTVLHPGLRAAFGDIPTDEQRRQVGVVVQGGDTLGWVDPHGAMDFSVTDRSLHLSFLNPSRYPEDHIYSADVMAYYQGVLLQDLLAITMRLGPPWGGKVDYDIAGRIIGNWFLEGTSRYDQWSRQLAIVYDNIYADRIIIGDGSPMRDVPGNQDPGRPDVWWIKGNAPRPENIGAGDGIVEWELTFDDPNDPAPAVQGVMLVEMVESGKIRVETFKGMTADQVDGFTAAARIYVR